MKSLGCNDPARYVSTSDFPFSRADDKQVVPVHFGIISLLQSHADDEDVTGNPGRLVKNVTIAPRVWKIAVAHGSEHTGVVADVQCSLELNYDLQFSTGIVRCMRVFVPGMGYG